jgi:hypothetical protein
MKRYVIYNKTTGAISRAGVTSNATFASKAGVGADEEIIEGFARSRTHKVVDGKVVRKPPDEIAKRPPKRPVDISRRRAQITIGEWESIKARVAALEDKVGDG